MNYKIIALALCMITGFQFTNAGKDWEKQENGSYKYKNVTAIRVNEEIINIIWYQNSNQSSSILHNTKTNTNFCSTYIQPKSNNVLEDPNLAKPDVENELKRFLKSFKSHLENENNN